LNWRTAETPGLSVKGRREIAQKAIYVGKAIRLAEAERTKGGREYVAGEGQFHKRKAQRL